MKSVEELPDEPPFDGIIHAGDLLVLGSEAELDDFCATASEWFPRLATHAPIIVPGNHDRCLDATEDLFSEAARAKLQALQDELTPLPSAEQLGMTIDNACDSNLRIVLGACLPRQPKKRPSGKMAFGKPRGPVLIDCWRRLLPPDLDDKKVDLLVTHTPQKGVLDAGIGDDSLTATWFKFRSCRPRVHIHGHAHAARGVEMTGNRHNDYSYVSVNCAQIPFVLDIKQQATSKAD